MGTPHTAITGGIVVNDTWSGPATVLIAGRQIVALVDPSAKLPPSVQQVIAAGGRLVLPGGVDPHCHVKTEMGSYTTLDDYGEATSAAIWGGTTTIVDFAIPTPGQTPWDAVTERLKLASLAKCDTALHGCVTEWEEDTADQLAEMAKIGVRTVKLFTTYRDSVMATSDTVLKVMQCLSELGGIAYIHAESNHLVEAAHEHALAREEMSAAYHSKTRPEHTEEAAVSEILNIAEALGSHAYFVHQSTPRAVELVREARARGVLAYSETCPHYLLMNNERYAEDQPERYVCCPPLRSPETMRGLRESVIRQEVQTIGSDHNCFDLKQKLACRDDVRHMPNGMPGVELRLPLIFSELAVRGSMHPQALVAMLCANPARLNGIYPRKGVIAPGADADVVILNTDTCAPVAVNNLHMATDYSPFEGVELRASVETVLVGGQVVLRDGAMVDNEVRGRQLESAPSSATLLC
ncbi:MAG TPA: amidohydrolase family protein [Segeticoccus sp.]|uniref:amidohydrolase family protein n=1 Tax=Segeticoccus sp. TaxID=2706531 RepID=UPI002D7F0E48|nr:amidohydrolase family protein [Segeticoccus sp.]HET8600750.1 amidohydrolase family protein [Segeticoccus sp.]